MNRGREFDSTGEDKLFAQQRFHNNLTRYSLWYSRTSVNFLVLFRLQLVGLGVNSSKDQVFLRQNIAKTQIIEL